MTGTVKVPASGNISEGPKIPKDAISICPSAKDVEVIEVLALHLFVSNNPPLVAGVKLTVPTSRATPTSSSGPFTRLCTTSTSISTNNSTPVLPKTPSICSSVKSICVVSNPGSTIIVGWTDICSSTEVEIPPLEGAASNHRPSVSPSLNLLLGSMGFCREGDETKTVTVLLSPTGIISVVGVRTVACHPFAVEEKPVSIT